MSETNGNRRRASVDVIEDRVEDQSDSFYDPANPVFAAPRPKTTSKEKAWKRKLVVWGFVLFLIVGGVLALYLLLRVNKVDVKVQDDARRDSSSGKAEPTAGNSENGLSAEAINIARQAIGTDSSANGASQSTAISASPSPSPDISRVLSFTDNSPAYSYASAANSASTSATPTSSSEVSEQTRSSSFPTVQSHPNPTKTLFVEDSPPRSSASGQSASHFSSGAKSSTIVAPKAAPTAVLPPFGTMLPVRTQGVIFSLRNNSYARLELARDCEGDGWSLPKGTLLIGRVNGGEYDRAFINIQGYIDPRTNRFIKMSGEVLGSDGGSGMQGKRVVVDRKSLKQTLSKVASSGLQVAGMMAGALTGRGTIVLNGAGYRVLNPITDETGRLLNGETKRSFVKVEAGQPAYVMVEDLPKELHSVDAPGDEDISRAGTSLTDREVMELILFGSAEDIRAALPLMNDEQKRLALKSTRAEK